MNDEIFKKFKEYSVAEFFKKNKQMLGFSGKIRSLTTIVHEYVTNSLDACEEHGILPNIKVIIKEVGEERIKVRVEDNGPGLPKELIGKALGQMLAGTKFARYAQQRGQQGIGAAGCTMFALLTTGKPIYVESKYRGKLVKCYVAIDFKNNSPIISNLSESEGVEESGLTVEGEFGEVKYENSQYGVLEYLRRTAIANPHAQITLEEPNGNIVIFPRSDEKVPEKPKEILPHPLGISAHDLIELSKTEKEARSLKRFLEIRFSRVSQNKIKELQEILKDINFEKDPKELSWEEAEKIVKAFKNIKWMAPSSEGLVNIGKEQIEKALKNILMPDYVVVVERPPKVFKGGIPFSIEVAICYGGNSGKIKNDNTRGGDLLRFANKAPLLFDGGGCVISEVIKEIDWKRYGLKSFEEEPISIFININSVYIPYTGAGKQAIAKEEEIENEIKNAVQEAARNLQKYINSVIRERERETKKRVILRYVDQLTKDLSELSEERNEEEIRKKLTEIIEKKYKLMSDEELDERKESESEIIKEEMENESG